MSTSRSSSRMASVLAIIVGAASVNAQTITTTAGPSMLTSASTLKLAKSYSGNNFFDGFNFETADDPTGGYVNYVSRDYAQSNGLIDVQSSGAAIMRVNSDIRASGRGRDSVRLSSKDEFADGVYILDVNHIPVGCGVWPAWWTVVKNGWPTGGEIDIIEGANTLPTRDGAAWKATGNISAITAPHINRSVSSLHTNSNCNITQNSYMTGQADKLTCSAFVNANQGCGVIMPGTSTYGVESFGSQVNQAGGGWYAMWRDMEVSGGVYVYFWPRNSPNVPDDVRNPNAATTNVQGWGEPGANLTAPGCKKDFMSHVVVFNMAFCGDYTAATWLTSGCPTSTTCQAFVMNNAGAFAETYWSINSMRVYNAAGVPTSGSGGLTKAQIGGIAGGCAAVVILLLLAFWRYKVVKRRRSAAIAVPSTEELEEEDKPHNDWASPEELPPRVRKGSSIPSLAPIVTTDRRPSSPMLLATAKPRTGRTTLAPGKTARHHLDGETAAGFYHASMDNTPNDSSQSVDQIQRPLHDRRVSAIKIDKSRLSISSTAGTPGTAAPPAPLSPTSSRRPSTYSRPESRLATTPTFAPARVSERRGSSFAGEKSGGSWVG